MSLQSLLLVALAVLLPAESTAKHVLCYYGTWATYRPGDGKFDVENIDTSLCTHLVYTFVGINADGIVKSLDPFLDFAEDFGRDNFRKFNALKDSNPNVKTLLAVGGWNEGSKNYSSMAANPTYRKNFITSALDMIQTYDFDGFDIDWEYPNQRDTINGEADIDNFSQLLKEMKEEFDKLGLLLTAAVAASESSASLSYDIPEICKYLDIVTVMAYDLYGPWNNFAGHNAPLHKGQLNEEFTVEASIKYWLNQGCPAEKVVMGIPMYGKTYNLTDANQNEIGAPVSGAGFAGPFSAEAGTVAYNEFCVMLQNDTAWDVSYDEEAKVPYASKGINWVSFDNPKSVYEKVNWGLQQKLGGFMIWSLESDDFRGKCGEKFPLLSSINKTIKKYNKAEKCKRKRARNV